MKKLFFLVIAAIAINAGFSQSNVPNGDLENWHNVVVSASLNYWQLGTDPDDKWLTTINQLATVAPPLGPGPVTCERTTDAKSGTYAAKLISQFFDGINVFIPGMMGTATLDYLGIRAILGRACPGCRPTHLKGYYKFEPVNGDSCSALLLVSKWNTSTKKRDTIGYGIQVFKEAVSTYTPFDVVMSYDYPASNLVPDSMTLMAVSSAGFSIINFMGCKGQVGSTMYVDELELEYPTGIRESLMPEVAVKVYPNPAKDMMIVELSEKVKDGMMIIFNQDGKQVTSCYVRELINMLPVHTFANGAYYFRLKDDSGVLNTGSFVILK